MAYINENRQITIDEVAAHNDISRIQQSAEYLRSAKKTLEALRTEAEGGKGDTMAAIIEVTTEQISTLTRLIQKHEEASSLIRQVVAKYQRIDQEARDIIAAAQMQ